MPVEIAYRYFDQKSTSVNHDYFSRRSEKTTQSMGTKLPSDSPTAHPLPSSDSLFSSGISEPYTSNVEFHEPTGFHITETATETETASQTISPRQPRLSVADTAASASGADTESKTDSMTE